MLLEPQFKDNPVINAVLRVAAHEIWELKSTMWASLLDRFIETASGADLDVWGEIFGVARGALSDKIYRRFLRARLRVNASGGTLEDLIAVAKEVSVGVARIDTYAPNVLWLTLEFEGPGALIKKAMNDAKKAGIQLFLVDQIVDYFGFDGDPNALGFDTGDFAEFL